MYISEYMYIKNECKPTGRTLLELGINVYSILFVLELSAKDLKSITELKVYYFVPNSTNYQVSNVD